MKIKMATPSEIKKWSNLDAAIDNLIDSWSLDDLKNYAYEQLQAWAKTADTEEINQLLEEHGDNDNGDQS